MPILQVQNHPSLNVRIAIIRVGIKVQLSLNA